METKNLKISFPNRVWEIINQDMNWIGDTEYERIQNIVISSIFLKKYNPNSNKSLGYPNITDDLDVLEYMISSALELLKEKKIISSEEWKDKMYQKVMS